MEFHNHYYKIRLFIKYHDFFEGRYSWFQFFIVLYHAGDFVGNALNIHIFHTFCIFALGITFFIKIIVKSQQLVEFKKCRPSGSVHGFYRALYLTYCDKY